MKVSIVNCEKTACKEPFGIQSKKADISNLLSFYGKYIYKLCKWI
ncbi:hypothetical protein H477_2397 [[Clostridium] sordellii ATCC 9714]|nr:hypothetical protein H477_2397 [[Clostridium] sordellii ATCC 9714] [Paeniclostridium sordellii ATCC 9714]